MQPFSSPSSGRPPRRALFVETDDATRWAIRRAALDNQTTVRWLVGTIVGEWLFSHGYLEPKDPSTDVSMSEPGP
jgi:hypothetical protein